MHQQEGSRRQIEWKKQSIEGDLERQGMHVIRAVERHTGNEIRYMEFYYTSPYCTLDKITYDTRSMKEQGRISVNRKPSYIPHALVANAIPFGYLLSHGINSKTSLAVGVGLFILSRMYLKNVRNGIIQDQIAWSKYDEYAASLNSIPEPSELDMEYLAQ